MYIFLLSLFCVKEKTCQTHIRVEHAAFRAGQNASDKIFSLKNTIL